VCVAGAFRLDDGREQVGVDVVLEAGAVEHLAHLGWGEGGLWIPFLRGRMCCSGVRGERGWIGDGLDAEDGAGGDFDVVGVVGGCVRGGNKVQADVVAGRLLADAVEFGAVAQCNVLRREDGLADCGEERSGREARAEEKVRLHHGYRYILRRRDRA
jgi:hypothetical protein